MGFYANHCKAIHSTLQWQSVKSGSFDRIECPTYFELKGGVPMFSQIRAIRQQGVIARNAAVEAADRFHENKSPNIDSELYHVLAHLDAFQKKWEEYGKTKPRRLVRWAFTHQLNKRTHRLTGEAISYTDADVNARVQVILFRDYLKHIRGECPARSEEWNKELDEIEKTYEDVENARRDALIKYSTMIAAGQLNRKIFRHSVQMNAHLIGIEAQYPLLHDELVLLFDTFCPGSDFPMPEQLRLNVE